MSWNITKTVDTVTIAADKIESTNEALLEMDYSGLFEGYGPVDSRGKLYFEPDHMEHMDWLTNNEELCTVIAATGVRGDICFGALEGDNKGTFWGIRFNGDYTYYKLRGTVAYDIV